MPCKIGIGAANPYEATVSSSSHVPQRRALLPYAVTSALLLLVGFTIAIPGLLLLNQEWDLIPTRTEIFDVEMNGQSVSNAAAIRYFLGAGGALWCIATMLLAKSYLNWRHNRTVSAVRTISDVLHDGAPNESRDR
jgi:hypothetical protein